MSFVDSLLASAEDYPYWNCYLNLNEMIVLVEKIDLIMNLLQNVLHTYREVDFLMIYGFGEIIH